MGSPRALQVPQVDQKGAQDDPKTEGKPEFAVFTIDQLKVQRFRKVTGDITGKYSAVVTFRQTLTIPVKNLKVAKRNTSFLDLRGMK